jgi:hypothetical protein
VNETPILLDVTGMNTLQFFEYLARNDETRDLAHQLADAWADRVTSLEPELARPAA